MDVPLVPVSRVGVLPGYGGYIALEFESLGLALVDEKRGGIRGFPGPRMGDLTNEQVDIPIQVIVRAGDAERVSVRSERLFSGANRLAVPLVFMV